MVEEVNANNATPPTITINNNGQGDGKLVVTEGKVGNLLVVLLFVPLLSVLLFVPLFSYNIQIRK